MPLALGAVLANACGANAAPVTAALPFAFVDSRTPNTVGFSTGTFYTIGANSVVPNGSGGTTGSATSTDLLSGSLLTTGVDFVGTTAIPNQFARRLNDRPGVRGPWQMTFRNGANTATLTTPSNVGIVAPPVASNVTISGDSANPTFSWSYPAGFVDTAVINLYDKSRTAPGGGFDLVLASGLGSSGCVTTTRTTCSFTVPTLLAGGLSLKLGNSYTIALNGSDLRDPSAGSGNSNTQAVSRAFYDFTPQPSGARLINLPITRPDGSFLFNIIVKHDDVVWVDPDIAVGYDFAIGAGDPNFRTVILPDDVGDGLFDIYRFNDFGDPVLLASDVLGGVPFDFGALGIDKFRVLGIEADAALDPSNPTAFVTGLTFTADGTFTGTQTPIVVTVADVPEVATALMLLTALGGLTSLRSRPGNPFRERARRVVSRPIFAGARAAI